MNEGQSIPALQEEGRQIPSGQKKKGGRTKLLIILLLLVAAAAAFWYASRPQTDRLSKEAAAIEGLIPGKSDEEIQEILNQVVDQGMINLSINQTPVFRGREGEIGVQNIPANHYSYTVAITLDETGETLYQSDLIEPGYYINAVTLEKQLKNGIYDATATFHVYDVQEDADTEIATLSSVMKLSVMS